MSKLTLIILVSESVKVVDESFKGERWNTLVGRTIRMKKRFTGRINLSRVV